MLIQDIGGGPNVLLKLLVTIGTLLIQLRESLVAKQLLRDLCGG